MIIYNSLFQQAEEIVFRYMSVNMHVEKKKKRNIPRC